MRRLIGELRTQLKYQIIGPFLILAIVVAVVGLSIVAFFLARQQQDRFDNELAAATRTVSDAFLAQEQANLDFLREVAFAQRNDSIGAPAVADAFRENNIEGLRIALEPFFLQGTRRSDVRLDRLIAFGRDGRTIADFERPPLATDSAYITHASFDLSNAWFTAKILNGEADSRGDKYAGLIQFSNTQTLYLATIAPVRLGNEVVGGLIVAIRLDNLLNTIVQQARLDGIVLYDTSGEVIASTFGSVARIPALTVDQLAKFKANPDPFGQSLFTVQSINGTEYQFAYVPFTIRGGRAGILATARTREEVLVTWNNISPLLALITFGLGFGIAILGLWVARRITRPIEELAETANAVVSGDLHRRAQVSTQNEIGVLAQNFNRMTEHLIELLAQVRAEASQRAAIVESITDGIIFTDIHGEIRSINRATRRLLGISDEAPLPKRLSDLPLEPLREGIPGFGEQRAQDLYALGTYIVRLSIAEVREEPANLLGYVAVLQDLTEEVMVDRAKTNFIGTISHELRTPLTVIRGNADLLMRGLAGPLDDEQKTFVEAIRLHANNMTTLISNVITIANLDSGSLKSTLEPIEVQRPIEDAIWQVQSQIKAKGLQLEVEIPKKLPTVLADFDHVRTIMTQLLDNARRYTNAGTITIRVIPQPDLMRIEVRDTGRGIPPHMHEQIFERFIRGDGTSEGINSSERGIGLGLAICKQLVERLGGTIGVESAPGQGSTFFFTLRYANDTASPEKPATRVESAA
ncbi:ATP-binding protein [Chloroflexus sp.]|uniref:ATP-binding protein n=1 Tax=Chloroflexus sp. TaxID=1904827 RepID=UPI00298F37C8|nr:ATP-binding protein [Chloroflexus sp.]MDW8405946.1 ATP-binding protein [Chloroflexus sp.]